MILNLTQHPASPEQRKSGVVEPSGKSEIKNLLTFEEPPSKNEMRTRAIKLTNMAHNQNAPKVMIGGAPFFMSSLEKTLKEKGIEPIYAFTKRVVQENPETGEKKSIFKHEGFIAV